MIIKFESMSKYTVLRFAGSFLGGAALGYLAHYFVKNYIEGYLALRPWIENASLTTAFSLSDQDFFCWCFLKFDPGPLSFSILVGVAALFFYNVLTKKSPYDVDMETIYSQYYRRSD